MSLMVRLGLRFPDDADEQAFGVAYRLRLRSLVQVSSIFGGLLILLYALLDRYISRETWEIGLAIRAFVMLPAAWTALVLISIPRFDHYFEMAGLLSTTVALLGLIAICVLVPASFSIYALPIILVSIFVFGLLPLRMTYMLPFAAIMVVSYPLAQVATTGFENTPLLVLNAFFMSTAAGIGLLGGYIREVAAREQFVAAEEARKSRRATEHLLQSLMPESIVRRMQAGETQIADTYSDATIVFADLVGFTAMTRRLSPKHMVDILAKIFQRFDELADAHGLQRMKTLGDGYLAVGGIRTDVAGKGRPEDAAAFALALSDVVAEASRELGDRLDIRVGLHVGYLIVGVVGGRNLIFDCWGDAVNLAARLQGQAAEGSIVVSESAYLRLHHRFEVAKLGDVDLKGIGEVKAYELRGYKQPQALSPG